MNAEMYTNDSGWPENVPPQLSVAGGTFGAPVRAAPTAEEEVRSLPMRAALHRSVPALGGGGSGADARGGFVCTLVARTHRAHAHAPRTAERAHPPKFHKIPNATRRPLILLFYWCTLLQWRPQTLFLGAGAGPILGAGHGGRVYAMGGTRVKKVLNETDSTEADFYLVLSVVFDEDKCPYVMYPMLAPQKTPGGQQYLVFERAACDLGHVLRAGPLPVDDLLRLFDSMLSALRYLKEVLQIVHNDIKPENIMVMPDGTFQLGDFGCATMPNGWTEWSGTPLYMAPEMVARLKDVPTHVWYAADLWCLGMVMNEALLGATEWTNEGGHVLTELPPVIWGRCMGTIHLRRAQRVAGGDPRLGRIHDFIESALVKDPNDRPAVEDVELAGDAEPMQM